METLRVPSAMQAGTQHDGRPDPRVGEGAHPSERLPAGRLGRRSAEGMPRHANTVEVQPARQRVAGLGVPDRQLIEDRGHIPNPQQKVGRVRRLSHRSHALAGRHILPDAVIAAGVLQEDGNISPCRPVRSEVGTPRPTTAESVAEQHHRGGRFVRRTIHTNRNLTGSLAVLDDEVQRIRPGLFRGERIVTRAQTVGRTEHRGEHD